MGKLTEAVKIVVWKKQARALIRQIQKAEDPHAFPLGYLFTGQYPDVPAMKREVNRLYDQLAVIDPETPAIRYEIEEAVKA